MADRDDDLMAAVEAQFGADAAGEEPETPEVEEHEGEEVEEPEAPPAAAEDEEIEIAGRKIPSAHARNLVEFYDWARENPMRVTAIDAYLRGEFELVPAGQQAEKVEEPEPLIEETIDDPILAREFKRLREVESKINGFEQSQRHSNEQAAAAAIEEASKKFASTYDLAERDMSALKDDAARLNILPSLMSQSATMVDAVNSALETAYWRNPQYRDREITRRLATNDKDQKRQRKASSLAGSSGSVPRGKTDASPREQMVAEIRQAMSGVEEN